MGSNIGVFSEFDDALDFNCESSNSLINDKENQKKLILSNKKNDENEIDRDNSEHSKDIENNENQILQPVNKTINSDYIYVLSHDNKVICFSATKCDLLRALHVYKSNYMIKSEIFIWEEKHETTKKDIIFVNVYERNPNFLFSYDRLVASFNIMKIPHFRTRIFNPTE
jgi:hypothetical protein